MSEQDEINEMIAERTELWAERDALTTERDALRTALELRTQQRDAAEAAVNRLMQGRLDENARVISQALAGQPEVRKEASKLDRGGTSVSEEKE